LTPALIGNVKTVQSNPIKMYVNYHDDVESSEHTADTIYIDWSKSFLSFQHKALTETLNIGIGPNKGPGKEVYLDAAIASTEADERQVQKKLVDTVPKIADWIGDVDYKAVLFGLNADVNKWWKSASGQASQLGVFCGRSGDRRYYNLIGVHMDSIPYKYEVIENHTVSFETL
jgi:hypothetical protein